mgnify:CR=1 FL=1|jgi:hypothetical protein
MRILLFLLLAFSFSTCSDRTRDLSGGYFLREEGAEMVDILSYSSTGREIPANVISYNYDEDFIIACQQPLKSDNIMYTNTQYFYGRDSIYYWLIVHHSKLVLGPLSKSQFVDALSKYKVQLMLDRHPYD